MRRWETCRACGYVVTLVVMGHMHVIGNHCNMNGTTCKGSYLHSREAVVSAVFELQRLERSLR